MWVTFDIYGLWSNFCYASLVSYVLFVLFLPGSFRRFTADYGVPLMVLVWTGISYAPSRSVPDGIPRRLSSPDPWASKATGNWTIIKVVHFSIFAWILFEYSSLPLFAPYECLVSSHNGRLCHHEDKPSMFHFLPDWWYVITMGSFAYLANVFLRFCL